MRNRDVRKWLEKEVEIALIDIPAILQRKMYNQGALEELAEDIREVGLINRITVVPRLDRFELVAGYRRLLAHKMLARGKIEVRIPNVSEEVLHRVTFAENYLREEIDPIDEAEWFSAIMEADGLSQCEIAAKLKRSESYVSSRLKLLEFPDYLQQAIRDRVLGTKMAQIVFGCKNDEDRRRILQIIRENGASESVVRYWADSANAEDARRGADFKESEFLQSEPVPYSPPQTFCDLCEQPADHMTSKFVRVCQECFQIAKANLRTR